MILRHEPQKSQIGSFLKAEIKRFLQNQWGKCQYSNTLENKKSTLRMNKDVQNSEINKDCIIYTRLGPYLFSKHEKADSQTLLYACVLELFFFCFSLLVIFLKKKTLILDTSTCNRCCKIDYSKLACSFLRSIRMFFLVFLTGTNKKTFKIGFMYTVLMLSYARQGPGSILAHLRFSPLHISSWFYRNDQHPDYCRMRCHVTSS